MKHTLVAVFAATALAGCVYNKAKIDDGLVSYRSSD